VQPRYDNNLLPAGHTESGGSLVEIQGKKFKEFYGMSSSTAMKKYHGKVANYRASEGKTIRVPYRGPVRNTVLDMLGGIRSACTYTGAEHLDQLCSRTIFIRVPMQTNEVFSRFEMNMGLQGYKPSSVEKAPSEVPEPPLEKKEQAVKNGNV